MGQERAKGVEVVLEAMMGSYGGRECSTEPVSHYQQHQSRRDS